MEDLIDLGCFEGLGLEIGRVFNWYWGWEELGLYRVVGFVEIVFLELGREI